MKLDPMNPWIPIWTYTYPIFFADLHIVNKLAYNTILLHKSVIATLCNAETTGELGSHVLVGHILKSIALSKPVPREAVHLEYWPIGNLLKCSKRRQE